ncbi:hypothetical protein P3542_25145, partial [Vibrio parahaemolyticus]|nr:hypothetical protein [Vibrio parahaemolyticus]
VLPSQLRRVTIFTPVTIFTYGNRVYINRLLVDIQLNTIEQYVTMNKIDELRDMNHIYALYSAVTPIVTPSESS